MGQCSIIIPTRERPKLLRRAVESALAALPADGEVIVVDDASETPADEVLADFEDPRLRTLINPTALRGGGSPSRNRGAEASKGGILFFLDDDDQMEPDYCARILDGAVPQGADFGFSARLFRFEPEDGPATEQVETRPISSGLIPESADFAHRAFPFSSGFWLTRKAFETAGQMATGLATNSDTEYCVRLYSKGLKGWYTPTPGVIIDEGETSPTQLAHVTRRTGPADRAKAFADIAARHRQFLETDLGAARFVYSRWLKHAIRAGDLDLAKAAINSAPRSIRVSLWLKRIGLQIANATTQSRSG